MEPGIYPNPTSNKFTLKSDRDGFTDVSIFDMFGMEMLRARFQNSIEIDVSTWATGVYVVYYGTPTKMDKVVKLVRL